VRFEVSVDGALKPADIPIAAEFEAILAEDSYDLEAEPLVECRGCWVGRHIACNGAVDVLAFERMKERGVQSATQAMAGRFRRTVDRSFNDGVVCRLGTKARGARVGGDLTVEFSDY